MGHHDTQLMKKILIIHKIYSSSSFQVYMDSQEAPWVFFFTFMYKRWKLLLEVEIAIKIAGFLLQLFMRTLDLNKSVSACKRTLSHVQLFATPLDYSPPGSSVRGILQARILTPRPPPGDLPDPAIEPTSLASPALTGRFFTTVPMRSSKMLLMV